MFYDHKILTIYRGLRLSPLFGLSDVSIIEIVADISCSLVILCMSVSVCIIYGCILMSTRMTCAPRVLQLKLLRETNYEALRVL